MSIRVIGFNNNLDHKLTETHIYGRLQPKDITGVVKDKCRLVKMLCTVSKTSRVK